VSDAHLLVGPGRLGQALLASLQALGEPAEFASCRVDRHIPLEWRDRSVWLCTPDALLPGVATALAHCSQGPRSLIFCSGATPLALFSASRQRVALGKLHPLASFPVRRQEPFAAGQFFAITAESPLREQLLAWVARWQGQAFLLRDEDAPLYHLAAVLAANFLPVLVRLGDRLLREALNPPRRAKEAGPATHALQQPTALQALGPLVRSAMDAALDENLQRPFSGPASRCDWSTMHTHEALLAERDPQLVALYRALSAQILHWQD
jgi:predicted short-subunit dehydrogenase-like oxidoreductase (DUF2520 family)